MSRTSRVILGATVPLACWLAYAALTFAAEQQRLPSGGYGEAYGPIGWLKDACFWISVVATAVCVVSMPVLLRRATHAE
jgi:hypothetical protein